MWAGLDCASGGITAISLAGAGISGTLPSYLGLISTLVKLDLSGNTIR